MVVVAVVNRHSGKGYLREMAVQGICRPYYHMSKEGNTALPLLLTEVLTLGRILNKIIYFKSPNQSREKPPTKMKTKKQRGW